MQNLDTSPAAAPETTTCVRVPWPVGQIKSEERGCPSYLIFEPLYARHASGLGLLDSGGRVTLPSQRYMGWLDGVKAAIVRMSCAAGGGEGACDDLGKS